MLQNSSITFNCLMDTFESVKHILTSPVTVASNERTFSKLKLVKTHLRSTMNDDKLNFLLILGIEKDIVDQLDINKLVKLWFNVKQCQIQI